MAESVEAPVLGADPFREFTAWYDLAVKAKGQYPDAMTLATVKKDGRPSARTVLYKGLSRGGFQFFTNYESAKAADLAANPYGALVFFWSDIYRQLRVEGKVEKLTRPESEAYFATRARESQLGAWASNQSTQIPNSEFLENRFEEIKKRFAQQAVVPCPEYWGGFRLIPDRFEFWTGNSARLHYRYYYELEGDHWKTGWLAP